MDKNSPAEATLYSQNPIEGAFVYNNALYAEALVDSEGGSTINVNINLSEDAPGVFDACWNFYIGYTILYEPND